MLFKNLKVVELASVLAGPLVGSFFAELGAKVVKIENKKTGGDVTRSWKLPTEKASNLSSYFVAANHPKEFIFLDYTNPQDYKKVIQYIKEADIVVSNFKYGDAEKFKLDYQTLKEINPSLIYAELTGFGKQNTRTAYDVVLQAESGFMYMNGNKNELPVKMPVALIDVLAAHHLKEAILCALLSKNENKKGKYISISLYQCALASLANQASNYLNAGHIPQAIGAQHPNIAPYGDMYKTADDKLLVLAVGSNKQFKSLCEATNNILIGEDKRFESNKARIKNRESLNELIGQTISSKSASYWNEIFQQKKVPFGIIKNLKEVFQNKDAEAMIEQVEIENEVFKRIKTALI